MDLGFFRKFLSNLVYLRKKGVCWSESVPEVLSGTSLEIVIVNVYLFSFSLL